MADDMQLQIVLEAVDQSQEAFRSMQQAIDQITRVTGELTANFQSFVSEASKIDGINVSEFESNLSKIQEDMNKIQGDITKLSDETIQINASEAEGALGTMNDKTQKLKDTILLTEDELRKMTDVSSIKNSVGEIVSAEELAVSDLKKLYQQANDVNVIIAKKTTDTAASSSHSGHGESGGITNMGTQNDLMYGGMVAGAAALPIVAGFKDAIKTFGDFDQAVANVNSMMGDTPQQVDAIKQQLIQLSKTVPDGPVALANALYGIVGAGVPAKDSMNVLSTASKAAAAGQTDVGTATNALISVMDSYGLSAKDVGKISDQMFAANAAGAMTFTDFAKSVGTVAGPAAQVGISFDQVAGATAALTNEGLSAQRSTMGLRALLMGIAAPTAGATKEAKALGIEWDATALKQKGLSGMMQEAMKATGGNTQELKKLIPNIAAWTVATDLGGKGAQAYTQAMQTMAQSSGATDRAMAAQEQGFTERVDHMKAAIQSAQITFVSTFAPAIEKVASVITELMQKFESLSPNTQKTIAEVAAGAAGFLLLSAGVMGTLSAVGNAINGFKSIASALGFAEKATKELTTTQEIGATVQKALTVATEGQTAAQEALAAAEATTDALNPFAWVAIAIAALVALGVAIYEAIKNWGAIQTFLVNTWNSISSFLTGIWNAIASTATSIFKSIVNGIQSIWNSFTSWISNAAQAALQFVVDAFEWMYNHNYYFKDLVDFIVKSWQQIRTDVATWWNNIRTDISKWLNNIVTDATTLFDKVRTAISDAWTNVQKDVAKWWGDIRKDVSTWFSNIVGDVDKVLGPIFDKIGAIWTKVKNAVGGWVGDVKTAISTEWDKIVTEAEQWGSNMVHMIAQGITNAIGAVESAVSNVASKVKSFLGFHSPTEDGPASDSDTWAPNFVKMFAGGLVNGASQIAQAANAMISPLSSSISSNMTHSVAMSGSYGGVMGGAPVFNITVSGNVTRNEQELAKIVSREIYKQAKTIGKF